MFNWLYVFVGAGVLIVAGLSIGATIRNRRSEALRREFGPEYARAIVRAGDTEAAEAELRERQRMHDELELHALDASARKGFLDAWERNQAEFADDPLSAIDDADRLVRSVMSVRGYPVEDMDDLAPIVSVEHPVVVERYRRARAIAAATAEGASDEDQVQLAMQDYRALFVELIEDDTEQQSLSA